jgi:hypothetical protein
MTMGRILEVLSSERGPCGDSSSIAQRRNLPRPLGINDCDGHYRDHLNDLPEGGVAPY